MKPDLKFVVYVGAKPEDVWKVFTEDEATKAIFFGSVLDTTFEIGSPYRYVGPGADGDETVHVYGTVLAYEENRLMSFTEHAGPSYRDNHAELQTRVTMELEAVGNTTKVTLVNDRWPDEHPAYERTQDSWAVVLSNIKTYAETRKTLDFGW